MATSFNFDGKNVVLPGAYATITSGEQAQPTSLSYGKVLVIDTGTLGATYASGSGINGELASGKDAAYKFTDLASYQDFLKGGLLWKSAEALFKPDTRTGVQGVSEIIHARAAATTSALLTFTAVGGAANGGSFKVKTRDEGVGANGELTSTHLDKGFAYTIETGIVDTAKWVFKIWRGTWKGDWTDGIAYDEIAKADTVEKLEAVSPEFDNIQELIDWATTDATFNTRFKLDATSAVTGTGVVDAADVSAVSGFQLATGGTETYSTTALDDLLESIAEERYSFVIVDKYGIANYNDADLAKVIAHNLTSAKFKAGLFYGGGSGDTEFSSATGSIAQAVYFNSAYTHVVHGDVGRATTALGEGFRRWPSHYHACLQLGRTAGLPPQVPLTNKTIGVEKLYHSLSLSQKEQAVKAGVLVTMNSDSIGRPVVLQGINTIQNNSAIYTAQGQSFQISTMRIIEQINGELVVNAEVSLLNNPNGNNLSTLSANTVYNFTETYLDTVTATATTDNLIISYRDISVTQSGDAWLVNYKIVPNSEINKIFFTGFTVTN